MNKTVILTIVAILVVVYLLSQRTAATTATGNPLLSNPFAPAGSTAASVNIGAQVSSFLAGLTGAAKVQTGSGTVGQNASNTPSLANNPLLSNPFGGSGSSALPAGTYGTPGGGTVSGWSQGQSLSLLSDPFATDPVTGLTPSQTLTSTYGYTPDQLDAAINGPTATAPVFTSPSTSSLFANPFGAPDSATAPASSFSLFNETGPSNNYTSPSLE